MSTRSSLHDEVDGLLETTSQLLSRSRDKAISESGWGNSPGRLNAGGHSTASAYGRQASVRSASGGPDALEAAAARLRSSFDSASRKLAALKKTTSFKEPLSVNIPNSASDDEAGAPTPRLDGSPGRFGGSVALTEHSAPILERSASVSSPGAGRYSSAGGARTYNSFAGLQSMVSMVDDLVSGVDVVHSSPRADRPSGVGLGLGLGVGLSAAGSRHGAGSTVSGSRLGGSMVGVGQSKDFGRVSSPSGILRPPSRLGSPAMLSPRSPASRKSVIPPPAPGTKVPRRTQLQALLQKDLAAPYEVVKFKTEASSQPKAPANLTSLQGNLQERFDRVNRKLKNWELVETAATEKFNAAMEAALDAIFSKVKVSWVPSDKGQGKASASRKEEERSRKSSRSGRSTKAASYQDGSDGQDSRHAGSHAKGGRAKEASGEEVRSLSSQGSGRRGRRWEASTTSDISEDGRSAQSGSSRDSSDTEGGGRYGHHRTSSGSKGRDKSKVRSGDTEEDRGRQLQKEKPGRDKRGEKEKQREGGDYQQQHDRQQHPQQLWYGGPSPANGFPGGMGAASAALHDHGYGGSGSRQVHSAAVHPAGPYAPSHAPPYGAQPSRAPAHDGSYASPSSPSPGPYPMRVRHEHTGRTAASPGVAPSSYKGQGPYDGGYAQDPLGSANQGHWGQPWPSSALKSLQDYGSPGPLPPSAYADRMQPADVFAISRDRGRDFNLNDSVAARLGAESYRGSLASSGVQYYRPPPQPDGEQGPYSPTYPGSYSVQPDHAYGPPRQLAPPVQAQLWQQPSTQRPHVPYRAGAGLYQMHAYQAHAGYRGPGL